MFVGRRTRFERNPSRDRTQAQMTSLARQVKVVPENPKNRVFNPIVEHHADFGTEGPRVPCQERVTSSINVFARGWNAREN